uniref:Uncharacterized protein n=1 Tax=Pristionchus pacificus TaxID=54126 RepID=A0A2A6CEC9_PRIPA|eukprot:PDM76460.1 hypothetical protein PRIPAC_40064 [Pristionchus pacificus]
MRRWLTNSAAQFHEDHPHRGLGQVAVVPGQTCEVRAAAAWNGCPTSRQFHAHEQLRSRLPSAEEADDEGMGGQTGLQ